MKKQFSEKLASCGSEQDQGYGWWTDGWGEWGLLLAPSG